MATLGLKVSATSTCRAFALSNSYSSTIRFAPSSLRQGYPSPCRIPYTNVRYHSNSSGQGHNIPSNAGSERSSTASSAAPASSGTSSPSSRNDSINPFSSDWEATSESSIHSFDDLPHRLFGANQHMIINYELKEALRLMLRQFNAPIVYCFAYGSGVFPQEAPKRTVTEAEFRAVHPHPPEALYKAQRGAPKMIDFIFGVSHVQHWHSINMKQHRDHYSSIASLGSGFVSRVQNWGAGVYFNPFIEMNGMLIKYGVTSIDNLVEDLSSWESLYLAGRLQKPVKILRDHPRVRLANQHNLIAAVRTALLLLPPDFTEAQLYGTIAGLSYLGDPRMSLPTEDKSKVDNIVENNIIHFRRLYAPLIQTLPNIDFSSSCRLDDESWVLNPEANNRLHQDMDPVKRGNMVRRLPKTFRSRLYFRYQKKFSMPKDEFNAIMKASAEDETTPLTRQRGGEFEKRIAADDAAQLQTTVRNVIKQTVNWPSTTQSIKGVLMGGFSRTVRYLGEKIAKWRKGQQKKKAKKAKDGSNEKSE
ncbi:mitochondrial matrix Mmp37-domain-containing protein [Mariannaea sp. PMI_226]|nr:mitochondrial matrix Mmp37-domain-containing protein [Mariannaea sp. PMI_226]